MKHYIFDEGRGVIDESGNQVLQLVGGTAKFRRLCGALLVERLNVSLDDDWQKSIRCYKKRLTHRPPDKGNANR